MRNPEKAIAALEDYRWSSHLDYCGIKNFPSVTSRSFLTKFFGGPNEYKKRMYEWIQEMPLEHIQNVALESVEAL